MSEKPVVVFLYTELAGYIHKCMDLLAESGVDVHVFAYPVNAEAPFQFDLDQASGHYYNRRDFGSDSLKAAVLQLNPDMLVCSGWIDAAYLNTVRAMPPKVKTVLALDNQLPSTIKGWLSLLRARMLYRRLFRYAWVPGDPQVRYAKKLDFAQSSIFKGFYAADVEKFKNAFRPKPDRPFPKRFVFVGRYLEFKGISDLWAAFDQSTMKGWELWCAGQGPLYPMRPEGQGIHHLGFVQPDEMGTFVSLGGVFVLPSHKEPWGVVVHEFAAAGFPLICSKAVGAATAFLKEGNNGFAFEPGKISSLKTAMEKMAGLSDEGLLEMSKESARLAEDCTPVQWVDTVRVILQKN